MESFTYNGGQYWPPRPQSLHRQLRHSHNGSPSGTRGMTRVAKPSGTSHSPHHVQRRRTTASHSARASHGHGSSTQQAGRSHFSVNGQFIDVQRPVSWHPGFGAQASLPPHSVNPYGAYLSRHQIPPTTWQHSTSEVPVGAQTHTNPMNGVNEVFPRPDFQSPSYWERPHSDQLLGNTISGLQTLAVSGPSRQSLQISRHQDVPESGHTIIQPQAVPATMTYSYPELAYSSQYLADGYHGQSRQHPISYNSYSMSQGVTQSPNDYALYASPTSPNILPIQYPSDFLQVQNEFISPHIVEKKSKELVGMGLYDDKNVGMFASLDHVGSEMSGLGDSLGKGLKLEETWKPPGNDDDNDEGYSTDDAEEELPIAPAPQEVQTHFVPVAGDLSNQTFFFENDEQYSDWAAFGQSMPAYPSKPLDPASGNFLWF